MSYNEVGGVFDDNEPEKVEITFSKVDDTFLDKFNKFLERAESRRERYNLTWNGKAEAFAEAGRPLEPAKTLRPDLGESVNFDKTQNLFITGDNLEALKLLQESYLNKVDMIYIDPPYNTGHDFVYHDNFHRSQSDEIDDSRNDDGNRQYAVNSKENGRYHSDWLSMMYSRLMIARNLLSENGVIFISIDDSEQANLKLMCDEVFGRDNFVACIVVNRPSEIATGNIIQKHEYCLCYARDNVNFSICGVSKYTLSRGTVGNADQTQPIITFPRGIKTYGIKDGVYETTRKIKGSSENIENLDPIIVRDGQLAEPVRLRARWRSSNDMRNFFANNCRPTQAKINGVIEEIYFDGDRFNPTIKKSTYQKISDTITNNVRGSKRLEELEMRNMFDNPKCSAMIKELTELVSSKQSTILDFFAGSGTTADAVMQLNAEDGGHRKFIMVQLPEDCNEKSEAYKAGYKTIDQLSRERIRRAAKKIKESDKNADDHDYGFRALYIDKANTKDDISVPADSLQQNQLSFQVDDIYADRSSLDLLFGVLVAKGWQLDGEIEHRNVDGNDVYLYDYIPGAGMIACFDNELTDEAISQIIDMHPLVAVFRETAFKQSDEKINLMERFKNDSPETRVWVI